MAKSFEELRCWQSARELVQFVFKLCDEPKLARDFGTRDRLKRAAVSVMNNIAEGFGRKSHKEFARFLEYAQSSAMEVCSMSYILDDLEIVSKDHALLLREKSSKLKIQIRAFSAALKVEV